MSDQQGQAAAVEETVESPYAPGKDLKVEEHPDFDKKSAMEKARDLLFKGKEKGKKGAEFSELGELEEGEEPGDDSDVFDNFMSEEDKQKEADEAEKDVEDEEEDERDDDEKKADEEAEKKKAASGFDAAAIRTKVLDVLKDLTPEQRDEVLGTTDDAFAALTHKARKVRTAEGELKAHQEEFLSAYDSLEQERQQHQAVVRDFDERLRGAAQNPVAWLELAGWSMRDAYEFDVNGAVPADKRAKQAEDERNSKVERELAELRAEKERLAAANRDQAAATWHSNVVARVSQVTQETHPNLSRYAVGLKKKGLDPLREITDAVKQLQLQHLQTTRRPIATDEVLGQIEKRLALQREILADPESDAESDAKKRSEVEKGPRTLSKKLAAGSFEDEFEGLSDRERLSRAKRVLRGEG